MEIVRRWSRTWIAAVLAAGLLASGLLAALPANAAAKRAKAAKPAKASKSSSTWCTKKGMPTRLGSLAPGKIPVPGTKLVLNEKYTGFSIQVPGRSKAIGPFTGTSPKFIGDGSRILYSRGLLVRAVRSDGTGDTPIVCGFNPTTTSDGNTIFFGGVNGLDMSFQLTEKARTPTVVSDTGGSISISPDETLLAFDSYVGNIRQIKLTNLQTGSTRNLFEMNLDGFGATEAVSWSSDSKHIFAGLLVDPCCTNPLDQFYKISISDPSTGVRITFDESYSQRAPERMEIL
jgi:hypothetical protein